MEVLFAVGVRMSCSRLCGIWGIFSAPGSWVGLRDKIIPWQVQYERNPRRGKSHIYLDIYNSSTSITAKAFFRDGHGVFFLMIISPLTSAVWYIPIWEGLKMYEPKPADSFALVDMKGLSFYLFCTHTHILALLSFWGCSTNYIYSQSLTWTLFLPITRHVC